MTPIIQELWREAATVAVLVTVLWAGHRGWWHWGPGVKILTAELSRERDDWRMLAIALLRKQGIDLPPGFEHGSSPNLPGGQIKRP